MAVLLCLRLVYSGAGIRKELKVLEWDAFGYYLYLPSGLLYGDLAHLDAVEQQDKQYHLSGGHGMPAVKADNGRHVLKYLGGVSIMELPFFAVTHAMANPLGYPADGFSSPYQYAVGFGALLYGWIALLVLRRVLLRYFSDGVTAAGLLLLALATNYPVYAAIDSGLSHGYIFLLYALVLYTTQQWHLRPNHLFALATGYLIGFATICRPTEAIMLFIPLLWGLADKQTSREKWSAVRRNPGHIALAVAGGVLGILPQLLYWKAMTGSFIFDVGSKWVFLNPNWRVLFGPEKGWLVYTPITILFLAGLFFIRRYPFRWSALIFLLLNIWIVIAWDDWRYGGSYSTRALVQSYPVFALPLCALLERAQKASLRPVLYFAAAYLTLVNLFQVTQYASTVLHFNDMNWAYYRRIYLNPAPTPEIMSLLDTKEFVGNEASFPYRKTVYTLDTARNLQAQAGSPAALTPPVVLPMADSTRGRSWRWLKVEANIIAPEHLWGAELGITIGKGNVEKSVAIRLFNPIGAQTHRYALYIDLADVRAPEVTAFVKTSNTFSGRIGKLEFILLGD